MDTKTKYRLSRAVRQACLSQIPQDVVISVPSPDAEIEDVIVEGLPDVVDKGNVDFQFNPETEKFVVSGDYPMPGFDAVAPFQVNVGVADFTPPVSGDERLAVPAIDKLKNEYGGIFQGGLFALGKRFIGEALKRIKDMKEQVFKTEEENMLAPIAKDLVEHRKELVEFVEKNQDIIDKYNELQGSYEKDSEALTTEVKRLQKKVEELQELEAYSMKLEDSVLHWTTSFSKSRPGVKQIFSLVDPEDKKGEKIMADADHLWELADELEEETDPDARTKIIKEINELNAKLGHTVDGLLIIERAIDAYNKETNARIGKRRLLNAVVTAINKALTDGTTISTDVSALMIETENKEGQQEISTLAARSASNEGSSDSAIKAIQMVEYAIEEMFELEQATENLEDKVAEVKAEIAA